MSLTAGRSLSHYRLIEPIGEGGMGVVWKANDGTLGRDVAIKVLPDLFASDPERLARFEREARLLASLNHPHVASIYGFHSADGVRFLAMELVEGEDLAQRIAQGPVPVAEALPLALQIAQGLEHAHEKGVIHRDLKPANVKLTATGQAKVLDFGLAKALEGDPGRPASSAMLSQSPTITGHMTGANVLLGTAAYMAPEQARGQVADKRADIWAFGALLMEMLTGRRLFEGETISDTLASVLKTDPDWNLLPADTPGRIRALLKRCLQRDPKKRLRDIGEARIALEEVLSGAADEPAGGAAVTASETRRAIPAALAIAILLVGIVATFFLTRSLEPPRAEAPLLKFRLGTPVEESVPSSPAISPDGHTVTFLSDDRLWIQTLGELEPRELKVDQGASLPFWSPDGKHVGYLAGTRIMKVAVASGEDQAVCDVRGPFSGGQGAAWGENGMIVFSRGDSSGLLEVPALGGDPRAVLKPDSNETDFHEPFLLPGGRGVLFSGHRRRGGINNLTLWSGGKRKLLLELPDQVIVKPVYSPTGHILFRRTPTTPGIWALPFSLSRLEATGDPFLVVPGGASPCVSENGTLVYVGGAGIGSRQFGWASREGKDLGTIGQPEPQGEGRASLAPDGIRVAHSATESDNTDIWILDTVRGTRTRLTFDPGMEGAPDWSPSGDRVAYHATPKNCNGPECWNLLMRAANGTGAPDTLASAAAVPVFTPDGRHVVFTQFASGFIRWNLMATALEGDRKPFATVQGNPRATEGRVSPGGGLLAYMSNESGEWEVYLARFPSGEGRWQVSVTGGQWPRWNAKGDRLYFAQGEDIMEVEISGGTTPILGRPQKLFSRPALGIGNFGFYAAFDVTRDGSRFVISRPAGEKGRPQGVTVVQSWFAEFAGKK